MATIDLEALQRRSVILDQVRRYFIDQGYWEVETPLLSHDTCVDRWLNPFEMNVRGERCFLQTSPEFAMKRLLCQGADSIFQVCKAFRKGESGENHNPEFTMVEWYRVNATLSQQITFVESLVRHLYQFVTSLGWLAVSEEFKFHSMTYESAFKKFAGLSAMNASADELLKKANQYGWIQQSEISDTTQKTTYRDDLLNFILANAVEPEFTKLGGVFLTDYPATQAALATIRKGEHPVAERFEMYLHGIEICNGYQELTDPEELRERMISENRKRKPSGEPEYPVGSYLVQEMRKSSLPECSGVALGFDRLAMLLLGKKRLHDVIAFPFESA